MPNRSRDAGAICPFYVKAEKNIISCECAIGGARVWHVFESRELADRHYFDFCASMCYLGCPYAMMLCGMYEKEDSGG